MPTVPATRQESNVPPKAPVALDRESLSQAFESFSHVAGSLETSYLKLQEELARLRHELEVKNERLARSLADNERMRTYLAGLLEDLPCGVLAVDGNFRLRFANPQARGLLAAQAGREAASAARIPEALGSILQDIVTAPPGAERVWAIPQPEGNAHVAVTCALRPQRPAAGDEMVFILRDVTGQRRLEEAHEFARRMKALAEITALLAHEIRNPLGSLELFAGLIKEATTDQAEVSQWVLHMQAGLRALSATVNNVLHFHSMAPPRLTPLNVVGLLADTIQFLQPLALQRGMGIEFEPGPAEILVSGDPHRLQQVFFNLAINAFRAMPSGTRLTLRARVEEWSGCRHAKIEFADCGVGIAPEHMEKIFDPGFTTAKSSPGLGLAVCRRLTAQHRGAIEVQSQPGKGTTFTLYFPLLGVRE